MARMSDKNEGGKPINLSPHAKEKLKRLVVSGITEDKAIETIKNPESLTAILVEKSLKQR